MPKHREHLFVDRLLFDREYKRLHEAIDYPVRVFGRSHRQFFHTIQEAIEFAILLFPFDSDAIFAARIHVWLDNECSCSWKFRRLLENAAKQDEVRWKNPLKTGLYRPLITQEDLLLRFFASTEKQQRKANSKSKHRPKKRKRKVKQRKKKDSFDQFFEWLKFYRTGKK